MAKLSDLEQLRDGWDGPGSKVISACAVAAYTNFVAELDGKVPDDLEPMADRDGGIVLEWDRGRDWFSATIQAGGGLYLCRIARAVDDDEDRAYPVFDAAVLKAFYGTGRIEVAG
ncbi:hypothetical protein [Nocardia sp. NPDC049149]|uniref:hypothetical protein n=1 Tax=Nocardia sp. NPDC049149 TaxID=3364315 RepID=UPI00371839EC